MVEVRAHLFHVDANPAVARHSVERQITGVRYIERQGRVLVWRQAQASAVGRVGTTTSWTLTQCLLRPDGGSATGLGRS